MWVATTLVLVALAPAQKNEGEELFKKMEEKVYKAKVVEFESDSDIAGQQKGSMNLKATTAEGNKVNFSITIEFGGRKQVMRAVADGKNGRQFEGDKAGKREETPRQIGVGLTTMVTRAGLVPIGKGGGEDPFKADQFDKDKVLPLSDFKLGAKEKVGDVEAQAVEYKVTLGEKGEKVPVTVWIDTKTNLPVKRVVEITERGQKTKMTETIKTFKLDGKVEDKTFELPKE